MNLRPYQMDLVERTYAALATFDRVMMQAPTGAGKTVLFSEITRAYHRDHKRVLLLVHRKELITQTTAKFFKFNVPCGIISAGFNPSPSQPIQLASVQTAIKRKLPYHFDLIIIDEAHHATANSYRDIVSRFPDAKVLGVTATPCRTDGSGFDKDFDYLVEGPSVRSLITDGYLVEPRVYAAPLREDLSKLKVVAGDYDNKAMSEMLDNTSIIGGLVDQYRKKADGKRTVVFAINVEHSLHIVNAYNAEGIRAAHVDGTTPQADRDRILRQFGSGDITVLSNVGIVTEGFDVPAIECVQLARPTKSLALYLQMVGRGLRPVEGKGECVILDHVNTVFEHGLPADDRKWTLKGVEKKQGPKQLMCLDARTRTVYQPHELPKEIEEVELVPVTFDSMRIAQLQKFIKDAKRMQFRPGWAWYKFIDKVGKPTVYEIQYAQRNLGFKEGWLKHAYIEHGYIQSQPSTAGVSNG